MERKGEKVDSDGANGYRGPEKGSYLFLERSRSRGKVFQALLNRTMNETPRMHLVQG